MAREKGPAENAGRDGGDALRQSEEKYRSLYRNTPVMMHSIDRAGRIVSVSEFWLSSLGYEEEEVIGRESVVFLTEESRRYARDVVLPAFFRTGVCRDVAYQFVKKDGTAIDVLLSAIAERDSDGQIQRSLAVLVDVTERNRALSALRESEAAIEESERRYRDIFENAGVSLWEEDFSDVKQFLDELGARGVDLRRHLETHPDDVLEAARLVRVENVNAETLALHGARSTAELLGGLPRTFLPESYDVFREELIALAEGLPRFASEAAVQTLGGQRRNILMTVVFPAHPKARALVSTLDITERKNLEERLRHSQKLEAVGQLAGGIAHDFNNLLAVILGRSDLLRGMIPDDPELIAQVELIRETVSHAARLTSHLLAFSRRQVLQPQIANLNEIVEDTVNMMRRLIGEDVEIALSLASELAPVRVDPGQIGQVVLNLALNARDAMPDGGRLSIDTYNGDDEPGRSVVLRIRDTGHGMDAATVTRIFEPFFTTKGPGQGTGLGLATVYGIVEQSGGRITVDSAPGKGATFHIHLPRAPYEAVEPQPVSSERDLPRGHETVLLTEDDSAVRAVTSDVLEAHGYRVLRAGSAAQALEVAAAHTGPIHLLLTDVVMPEVDGRDLAGRIHALRPEIRVLYISGYTPDRLNLEGTRLLMKPFAAASLLTSVRAALDDVG